MLLWDHSSSLVHPQAISYPEIHVWRAPLTCAPPALAALEATLSSDERTRAARFHFPRDRDSFVAGRGILRELLAGYAHVAPASLTFVVGVRGKPSLPVQNVPAPITFNLSHSHGMALYAFAVGREVGIDLEFIRPDIAGEQIATRFFAAEEVAELQALPQEQRPEAFFLCWTRKEAYIKARGEGLEIPLTSFRVSLDPAAPATLTSADASRWTLRALAPGPGYAAALVAEGHDWQLSHWDYHFPS
jgi:4'-phosphopantetheinyl transferase